MKVPYWVYKRTDHSPGWSGWRYKAWVLTWRPRFVCETCGVGTRASRLDSPIHAPMTRVDTPDRTA